MAWGWGGGPGPGRGRVKRLRWGATGPPGPRPRRGGRRRGRSAAAGCSATALRVAAPLAARRWRAPRWPRCGRRCRRSAPTRRWRPCPNPRPAGGPRRGRAGRRRGWMATCNPKPRPSQPSGVSRGHRDTSASLWAAPGRDCAPQGCPPDRAPRPRPAGRPAPPPRLLGGSHCPRNRPAAHVVVLGAGAGLEAPCHARRVAAQQLARHLARGRTHGGARGPAAPAGRSPGPPGSGSRGVCARLRARGAAGGAWGRP
jgi:hypothetical protein